MRLQINKNAMIRVLTSALLSSISVEKVYIDVRNEGNVLFKDALNTFYLRLYTVSDIWYTTT